MVKKNIQKKIPSFMSDKIEANSLSVNGDDAQLKRTRSKISNISLVGKSIPSILFGASIYSLPWSISSKEFRLSLFAEEGSLYGFLFAFIFIKAFRMVLYYIYNDVVSIISHRLLLPLLKRQGHDTKVSLDDHNLMLICLKSSIIHKHPHLDQHMPCLF